MSEKFIAQIDETCILCDREIPCGSWFGTNSYDEPICQDCLEKEDEYEPI